MTSFCLDVFPRAINSSYDKFIGRLIDRCVSHREEGGPFACHVFVYDFIQVGLTDDAPPSTAKSEEPGAEFSSRKHVTKLVRVTTGRKRRSPRHDDGRLVKTCPRRGITTSSIVNLEIARRDVRETATRSRDAITDPAVRTRVPENPN